MCVRNMHLSANVFEEMTKESGQLTKNELCLLINVFIYVCFSVPFRKSQGDCTNLMINSFCYFPCAGQF